MNKRIFIFGGVFVSLCMLFLVHCVKSSNKNKEKYFISIEKQSDGNGVTMTIKKNDNKTVVNTCQLEKKNSLTNDKFQNVYSLQDNDIAEILNNSECEFLDKNNKKVEDKSILAIGTLERIHNPILRFFFSCILEDKQYVIYCDDANSKNANGLFQESEATGIEILSCGNNVTDTRYMFLGCRSLTNLDVSKWNTDHVNNMYFMFYNCFIEKQTSTLICKASTIKKITDNGDSCLTITNEVKYEIKDNKVYKCSVERKGGQNEDNCPKIKDIEEIIEENKVVEGNKKEDNKIKSENKDNNKKKKEEFSTYKGDKGQEPKIEEVKISDYGKIDDIQIVNAEFVKKKLVKAYGSSDNYEAAKNKFLEIINPTGETHLSAYVEVEKDNKIQLQCFVLCKNANSISDNGHYYGLFQGSEATKIVILSCGSEITDISWMFYNCKSLTNIIFPDNFNTSKVINMSCMFDGCSSLTELNLSNFTTNNVTNMFRMFGGCSKLTVLNLSNFNTQNVTNMICMFYNCTSLNNINLSNWKTHNVTNMDLMFFNCSSLKALDLSSFNTINVTNMRNMFKNCSSLKTLNLSSFNTNNVTEMSDMFTDCFKEKQTSFLICKASTIQKITENEKSRLIIQHENENKNEIKKTLNKNLNQVYTCTVKRVGNNPEITEVVKPDKVALSQLKDIPANGKIDDIQIVNEKFVNLVVNAYKYTGSTEKEYEAAKNEFLERIKPTCETHLSAYVEVEDNGTVKLQCFIHCTDANSKIDGNVIYGLFQGSEATKIEILSCGSEITNMSWMFAGCRSLTNLDLSSFNTTNVTNMQLMFHNCDNLKGLDLSNFNTKKVTDMNGMFSICRSLTNLNLSSFNTDNVTDMRWMFSGCNSLTKLDLSNFNTKKVTNMSDMFANCSSLIALDLSKFNTNTVKDMSGMFYNCSSLKELDLSSFNTENVTNMQAMFYNCSKLTNIKLSSFNTNNVTSISKMFYKCFKNEATLICTASTIKKIADNGGSCLIIPNEKKTGIENIIENNNNPNKVYRCSVKRGVNEDNPQITEVA